MSKLNKRPASMTAAERQRNRTRRMKEAGYVLMKVWVPPGDREKIRDLEKDLQEKHKGR